MNDEGVIKYQQDWTRSLIEPSELTDKLIGIRNRLYRKKWIGQYPDGVGYGNASIRINDDEFLITGSGSGSYVNIDHHQLAIVSRVDIAHNSLKCRGMCAASSEALTHAAIYAADFEIEAVLHIHDAEMWEKLIYTAPTVGASIPYGTSEMANAVQQLIFNHHDENEIIVTAGHEDGIFAYGYSIEAAYEVLKNWSLFNK